MKIVIAGPKGSGKSALAKELVNQTHLPIIETDDLVEQLHEQRDGHVLSCREIFIEHGESFFRDLERDVTQQIADRDYTFIVTGGSILMDPDNRRALRRNALIILLTTDPDVLWQRATAGGIPPWLEGPEGRDKFLGEVAHRYDVLVPYADILVNTSVKTPEALADEVMEEIADELIIRTHSANTYGDIIHITTFGESHGPAIGAVFDGVQPGIDISADEIQIQLNRRRPGQSEVVTPRSEKDRVHILSGVFEGKTTGAPIAMVIYNQDQDSSKYEGIKHLFRPGHADFTYYRKYGIRDHRGGGRSSGRETAGRVMGGAIARKLLKERGVNIVAQALEIGGGFALTRLRGSQSNDWMSEDGFQSNNAGGITGGISTGQPIIIRIAVKPTSSIATPQQTVNIHYKNSDIETHGRHDPCIVPRVVPVIENMAALILLDAWEVQQRLRPGWPG